MNHRFPLKNATQCNPKGKMMNTPVLEQIHPIPPSHTKDSEASDLEEGDVEMDLDEHDLAGVDLVHLEQAYRKQELYTIPPDQLHKVHKVFLNSSVGSSARSSSGLGIHHNQQKDQRKLQKDEKKRGRKSTQQLIQEIGHFMVNSGQIQLISDIFPPLPPNPPPIIIMKLISWNIRGLNGHSKQRILRDHIIVEQPDILFLQETKCAGEEMEQILSRCWR
jgi:hypothetical protein